MHHRLRRVTRLKKAVLYTVLVLAVLAGSIEVLARYNMRQEQAARAYLGDRLYVQVLGQGDPVVFLAGLQASTEFWQHRFDPLARDHRLIFLDALGFGRSPWPDVRFTLDDHLGALRRTLVAKGATKNVTIVGHSFGTILAAYYAARYPEEIKRLYLVGTPVFSGEADARDRISEMSPIAALFSLNPVFAREGCMVMGAFRPLLRRVLPAVRSDLPPQVVSDGVLHDWDSINGTIRNVLLTKPVAKPLAVIGRKVTFVHGRADTITPLPRIRELAKAVGAQVIETPDRHLSYPVRSSGTIIAAIEKGGGKP